MKVELFPVVAGSQVISGRERASGEQEMRGVVF